MAWIEHFNASSHQFGYFVNDGETFGFNIILDSPNLDDYYKHGSAITMLRNPTPLDLLQANTLYVPMVLNQHCVFEDKVVFYFRPRDKEWGTTQILRCEHIVPLEELVKLNADNEVPDTPIEFILAIKFTQPPVEEPTKVEEPEEVILPENRLIPEAQPKKGWFSRFGGS